jgi:hypothetical protein
MTKQRSVLVALARRLSPTLGYHLSLQCPFAEQVWYGVMQRLGVHLAVPLPQSTIPRWSTQALEHLSKPAANVGNSLIMLVLRALCLERNTKVFL